MTDFRTVVKAAVGDWLKGVDDPRNLRTDTLARALKDRLATSGFRVVRWEPDDAIGRAMTPDEQVATGLASSDAPG